MQRRKFLSLTLNTLALGSIAASITACSDEKLPHIPSGSTVLAFGDSLTAGYGVNIADSYPTILSQLTGWNVVNGGVSGDTTAQALERLPALLQKHRPKLVLTCIGGNDFMRRVSKSTTRANIMSICQQIKASGAQNMLIAVPGASLMAAATGSLSDDSIYKEIAGELKLPLQSGAWAKVLSNESLKSDAIHGNEAGYYEFAKLLARTLKDTGLLI